MDFLRSYTYQNDVAERSDTHEVYAVRFSETYTLKTIYYTASTVYVCLYTLSEKEFNKLIFRYGRIISHTRRETVYRIIPKYSVWFAKYGDVCRMAIQYPSGNARVYNVSKQRLLRAKPQWRVVYDNGRRWLVAQEELKCQ